MATASSAIMAGMVSMGQLVVSADLINRYTTGTPAPGFPSGSVHTACVFALIAGIWGVVLAFIVPIANRADPLTGVRVNGAMAATQWLLSAFVLDIISAALLTNASTHGGACVHQTLITCHLYTANLALGWIMTALHLIGTCLASYFASGVVTPMYPLYPGMAQV